MIKDWTMRAETKPRSRRAATHHSGERVAWRQLLKYAPLFLGTGLLLVVVLLGLPWIGQKKAAWFAIRTVKIENSLQDERAQQIESRLLPYVQSDFFSVDLQSAKQALLNLSWVRDADIRRQWPHTLRLRIVEQQAVALWNESYYLNNAAQIYADDVSGNAHALPSLYGPEGTQREVMRQYHLLSAQLASQQLQLESLLLDARGSWRFVLSEGVEVKLGMQDMSVRMQKFLRLYKVYLLNQTRPIQSIDLRHSNGLAVQWKAMAPSMPSASTQSSEERFSDV